MSGAWYSAADLAGLPGLPGSERAVRERAKREHWQYRNRAARGGGREFALASLPSATRQHLALQVAKSTAANTHELSDDLADLAKDAVARREERQRCEAQWQAMPEGHKKHRARAREWLLRAAIDYAAQYGAKGAGFEAFATAYRAGEIDVPAKHAGYLPRYDDTRGLSRATLWRWYGAWREKGRLGLAGGYGNRAGTSLIDTQPELHDLVLGAMVTNPHIAPRRVREYISLKRPDLRVPSLRRLQAWMGEWKQANAQLWSYVTNPDQWKSVYMPAAGSAFEGVKALNQIWELDGTPGDWLLRDGRHTVLTVIDLYSRRSKFLVTKTSKAMAVCTLLRRAILDWGVPEVARVDNGKEYVSEQFKGALRALDIHMQLCVPFASEQKGTVERVQQTMSHGLLELLPGFCGHNVAERKVIEARKSFARRVMTPGETVEVALTAAELQRYLDDWTEHAYHCDSHSGLGGESPSEVANAWPGHVHRVSNPRALDCLLAEVGGTRTVTKKGIRLDNHLYDHADLVRGEEVHIKRDPDDIGRITVYGTEPARFICIAECPELLGITRAERAQAIRSAAKQRMAEQASELRALKKHVDANIPAFVLAERIKANAKVTALPRPTRDIEHRTDALDAAAQAAAVDDAPQTTLDAEQQAEIAAFQRDFKPATVTELQPANPHLLYLRWHRNQRLIDAGGRLQADEARWQERYPDSADYRTQRSYFADWPGLLDQMLDESPPAGLRGQAHSTA